MKPLRRLLALVFNPQPRRQPRRIAPTLAQLDDEFLTTVVVVSLDLLRKCRP